MDLFDSRGALISKNKLYRYYLYRILDHSKPLVMFVGLNPSTANALNDDRTIARCKRFCKSWGYGGFFIVNLFAWRSKDPDELRTAIDPVGPKNDHWIKTIQKKVDTIAVCAWGNNGRFLQRDKKVLEFLARPHYLKLTQGGFPEHPLYLPKTLLPKPWQTRNLP